MALYNLREYRPGDDSRAIHWMTTARTSKLMLKETEADDQRIVTILLSPVAAADNEIAFERAVSIAASLVAYFHDRDYSIRAVIGDEEIRFGTGVEHYVRILRALALCKRRVPDAAHINQEHQDGSPSREAGIVIGVMAAPADEEHMRLCPHPWPTSGSASYSPAKAITGPGRSPVHRATKAVSSPPAGAVTSNPCRSRSSAVHREARRSSKAISGLA